MKGIDISSNNGPIDFARIKKCGVEIIYIKATEGTKYINELLKDQYNGALAQGLKIGFYHFLNHDSANLQAQYFLNAIKGLKVDCKYCIDVENQSKWTIAEASDITRKFANYLIDQGLEVCIYTSDYFYRDTLNSTVKDIPLWVANYGGSIMAKSYIGLQYSETGRIEGINGNVDLDNFDSGILLTNIILTKNEEATKVKNLVVYGNDKDQRAAEYLADYLGCAIIDGTRPYSDYGTIENIYGVGGAPVTNGTAGWTGYMKPENIIAGADRFLTCQKVLDIVRLGQLK